MKIHTICGLDYDSNVFVIPGKIPTVIDSGTGMHSNYVLDRIKEIIDPSSSLDSTSATSQKYHSAALAGAVKMKIIANNANPITITFFSFMILILLLFVSYEF